MNTARVITLRVDDPKGVEMMDLVKQYILLTGLRQDIFFLHALSYYISRENEVIGVVIDEYIKTKRLRKAGRPRGIPQPESSKLSQSERMKAYWGLRRERDIERAE